ncbi:hypothetical protein ACFR9U_13570 [Halorientalis brevis]|uniref:Uncharacterized protein n=1 Tax=Halorientalis brevis TaxID=1126241 RepID=A0ABD6CCD9_9EURY|nr:hypothetical protein [Halorientalis brevis]
MTRHALTAVLVVAVVAVSGPAMAASATTDGTETGAADAETVVVRNAQVQTLQLNDSTVENVTIRVLRIDRMTVQNQTDGQLNETLGAEGEGPIVLRNVHFRNLSLDDASATGISAAGDAEVGSNVGNVSSAVIGEMTVDHLVVQQSNVSDGGGGIISGIIDRIRGLFGGDEQAGNETAVQPDLRVGSVDVSQLTVDQLDVAQVEEVEPGEMAGNETAANETAGEANETGGGMAPAAGDAAAADQATIGQITVENATIGTLSADAMVYQRSEQAAGNETGAPAGNETEAPG